MLLFFPSPISFSAEAETATVMRIFSTHFGF